jgi:hypothetical protein
VYWYWLNANVTREGIVADLDAMSSAGIGGVYLLNIGSADPSTLVDPPVEAQSPRWWELVRFAIARAGELGMTVAMNVCDGWGTAGGRWITPPISAHELVWSELTLKKAGDTHALRQPTTRLGYYRDVAAYAFPVPPDWDANHATERAHITTSWPVSGIERVGILEPSAVVVDTDQAGWVQYSFERTFTLRSVTVRNPSVPLLPFLSIGFNAAANSLAIEASDDGQHFRPVAQLKPPQLGWQSNLSSLSHSVPPVRARYFRFQYRPEAVETNGDRIGDGRFITNRRLQLASLVLASRPVVHHLPVKAAQVWGLVEKTSPEFLPDDVCIPLDSFVDVSQYLDASGTLRWRAPPGRWAVLRMGCTTKGMVTAPSGRAGGLECDKFNPEAVAVQFDGWFGEALRQIGPALAGKALGVLHIDSWEAGSQNWSPLMPERFRALRGYDLKRYLPVMANIPVQSADVSDRFLFDVRRTIGDLLRDNFFFPLTRLAHDKGCIVSAQATNASFPSDGMQQFENVDIPSGEFWKGRPQADKPSDIREAVSGARAYGKPIVAAEAFTGQLDWSEHPFSFKAQGDEHFCYGANRLVLHVWVHQAFPAKRPGVTLYNIGSFFSQTQPWWPMAHAWLSYLQRVQALLQRGWPVVDVCYFTGEDIPSRAFTPDRLHPSLPPGYAYDSINLHALMTRAHVRDGRIALPGGSSYALLALPDAMPITKRTAEKLRELVNAGATIVGSRPIPSPSLADSVDDIRETNSVLDELALSSGTLSEHLAALSVQPDVVFPEAAGGLDRQVLWTHRRDAQRDIYFISSQLDAPRALDVSFRIAGKRPALCDALSGRTVEPAHYQVAEDRTSLRLHFAPFGSIFVIFEPAADADYIESIEPQQTGLIPSVERTGVDFKAEVKTAGRWKMKTARGRLLRLDVAAVPEAVRIAGPWTVAFDNSARTQRATLRELRSWSQDGTPEVRFHSGTATYTTEFQSPARKLDTTWTLDLGRVANLAQVRLNGQDLGVLWAPPFTVDVTAALRRGRNTLRIVVANTWRNRLVGDSTLPTAERQAWVLPNSLIGPPRQPLQPGAELLPAGLLGPVLLNASIRRIAARA